MRRVVISSTFAAMVVAAAVASGGQGRRHVVKAGDALAEIARYHGVEIETLREINGLEEDDYIHPGDVLEIPEVLLEGWTRSHVVKRGDTLIRIARRYRVPVSELEQLNRLGPDVQLRLGQRVVIPKGRRVDPAGAVVVAQSDQPSSPRWDGKATVVRVRDSERKTMTILDKRGRVRRYAHRTISRLARSKKGRVRLLDRRLIALLGKVAEHFPGKPIEIISGYRPHKRGRRRSQHARGKAVDFRVRGVTNLELYEYIKTFTNIGVGYYPNSTFVHLDVRDRKYLWTDLSGPGERARYVRPGEPGSAENAAMEDPEGLPDPENFPDDGLTEHPTPDAEE